MNKYPNHVSKPVLHFVLLDPKDIKKDKSKSAPSSMFQRQHIDLLLEELIKKYPPQRAKVCLLKNE